MTFDERLEQALDEFYEEMRDVATSEFDLARYDVAKEEIYTEAITAIKQAMRETMPKHKRMETPTCKWKEHNIRSEGFLVGYNIAIDEIEKGFGL